jgi:hypothetical protein
MSFGASGEMIVSPRVTQKLRGYDPEKAASFFATY